MTGNQLDCANWELNGITRWIMHNKAIKTVNGVHIYETDSIQHASVWLVGEWLVDSPRRSEKHQKICWMWSLSVRCSLSLRGDPFHTSSFEEIICEIAQNNEALLNLCESSAVIKNRRFCSGGLTALSTERLSSTNSARDAEARPPMHPWRKNNNSRNQ